MVKIEAYNKLSFCSKKDVSTPQIRTNGLAFQGLTQGFVKPSLENLKAHFVSFTGDKNVTGATQNNLLKHLNANACDMITGATDLAIAYESLEVTPLHLIYIALQDASMALSNEDPDGSVLLSTLSKQLPDLFESSEKMAKVFKEIVSLKEEIGKKISVLPSKKYPDNNPPLSEDVKSAITELNKQISGKKSFVDDADLILSCMKKPEIQQAIKNLAQKFMQIDKEKVVRTPIKGESRSESIPVNINSSNPQNTSLKDPLVILNNINPGEIYNFSHFNHAAKALGPVVSSGHNAIIPYSKGSKPELVAHGFMTMLRKGEFKDLDPTNTYVSLLDVPKASMGNNFDIVNRIHAVAKQAKTANIHTVLFIKDYDIVLSEMIKKATRGQGPNPAVVLNPEILGNNLSIIGLMKDSQYKAITSTDHIGYEPDVHQLKDFLNTAYEKINMAAPSPKKAKEMLVENFKLVQEITSKYPGNIIVQSAAIEKAIDIAITSRVGVMPGTALDLIDFAIAAKCNATGNAVGSISAEDIERYAKEYPELRQTPESGSGQFSLIHDTGTTLKDVGGAAQAKEVVEELLDFIKNPQKFNKTGAKMPKGVLLSGSPGNGKTHLARAIAGEAGVPFVSASGSEFVEKYVGVGASRVRELFDFARTQARASDTKTAIIFIDEFDAIGRARGGDSGGGNREAEQTLNQLLTEMDGLSKNTDVNIVVLAATNRMDLLDDALKDRPGRFDHKIEVPNPANDVQARYEILSIHARTKKIAGNREQVLRDIAAGTSGSSGARLADIINKACIIAAKDDRDAISLNDLIEAKLESVAGRIRRTDKPDWFKEQVVAHEGGHALNRQFMLNMLSKPWQKANEIDIITTNPRGNFAGAVFNKPGENPEATFESVFSELVSKYGGYSTEKQHYGIRGSSGITSDFKNASALAKDAVTRMGMGAKTGVISVVEDEQLSGLMGPEIKEDVQTLLTQSARVSDMIAKFFDGFIKQYIEEYRAVAGKGGNNLSGEEFKTKLAEWIKANGKEKELEQLEKQVLSIMEQVQEGKVEDPKKRRMGF